MPYLIDASSLMILIKNADEAKVAKVVSGSKVLDLTYYEVGNVLLKQRLSKFITSQEITALIKLTNEVLDKVERVSAKAGDFQEILGIAIDQKLTFYDSSYVFFAKSEGLTLVTDDLRLAGVSRKYVTTKSASDIA